MNINIYYLPYKKLNNLKEYFNRSFKIMQFHYIIGNVPFQYEKENIISERGSNSKIIWPEFIINIFKYLKTDGYIAMIHPPGWRNVESGKYSNIKDLLLSRNIKYISMYSIEDSKEIFGVTQAFDFYILENTEYKNRTDVKFIDGDIIKNIDLNKLPFIPSGKIKLFNEIVELNVVKRINVFYDRSTYQHTKLNKIKNENFKYPIIYSINKGDKINIQYSNFKNGHFGIPKFVWSNGYIKSAGTILDETGQYGVSEYCYSIIDTPENLRLIKKAFDSKKFRDLMKYCDLGLSGINGKIISTFKKDFYLYFVDIQGNEI